MVRSSLFNVPGRSRYWAGSLWRAIALLFAAAITASLFLSASCQTLPPPTASRAVSQEAVTPTASGFIPFVAQQPTPTSTPGPAQLFTYRVLNTYPHDPTAFTQGLVFHNGVLYEGTGLYGQSTLRRVELETGNVLQRHRLADHFFGEGVTLFGDQLVQLTWKSRVGFVYHRDSFQLIKQFSYSTEGWGITHDGQRLIMSDGTPTLYFWDPETLQEVGRIEVRDSNGPVTRLNELEYIQGEVYANVWLTDRIARINPQTGWVVGWIDLTGLLSPEDREQRVDVLNGIAYDAGGDRLFVTGKLWPKLFEIELVPADSPSSP